MNETMEGRKMHLAIKPLTSILFSICWMSFALANPIEVGTRLEKLQIHSAQPLRVAITHSDIVSPPPDQVFQPTDRLNLGFFPDRAVWLQFELKVSDAADPNETYILEVPSRPGNAKLFRNHETVAAAESGVLIPISQRPYDDHQVIFPLKLTPGKVEKVTIRMVNRSAHLGFLNLYSETGWGVEVQKRNLLFGGYAGLMGALLLLSLALFIFPDRKWEGLLYILAQGSIHLAIPANILGYTAMLWPSALAADYQMRPLFIALGSASLGLFSSLFLRLRERAPAINIVLHLSISAVAVSWIWTYFDPTLLSSLTAPLTIWTQIFCFSLGCYFLYHGDQPARFYVVGFGSLLLSSLFTVVYTTYRFVDLGNAIPMPVTVIQISAVLNALTLAYAIIERNKEERELRLQAEIVSRQAAEYSNNLKSDLLRNLSHELRTPLNSIVGFSQVLEESLQETEAQNYAAIIHQNSNRLTTIINEILDYTSLESGELPLNHIQFSLRDLIEEILVFYQESSMKKDIQIQSQIGSDVPVFMTGDRFRVKQILMHVIGNAYQFTETGTLKVSAGLCPKDLSLVQIFVTDTGVGIHREIQKRLFEPFVQGNASATRSHNGLGMGLTFSKTLARHMGGDVSLVKSAPNEGTTIEIIVPVSLNDYALKLARQHRRRAPLSWQQRFAKFRLHSS